MVLCTLIGVQMELVDKEVVGMSGLDVPVGQDFSGKVVEVKRGPCPDSGGEHVPVVWVRQVEGADERLVAGHDSVSNREVHQFPGAL
jgi:hypothetical protein